MLRLSLGNNFMVLIMLFTDLSLSVSSAILVDLDTFLALKSIYLTSSQQSDADK
jgi:hypothetical protein